MVPEAQIAFMEVDGEIVFFNEAEAVVSLSQDDGEETESMDVTSLKMKFTGGMHLLQQKSKLRSIM